MPEYLAPGVFIEEVSFRSKSIEGVSTTTTGFIGPTRYGPIDLEPDVITSLGEFERVYGDRQQLSFGNTIDDTKEKMHNFMWQAVRAFFEEGGKRLYISRIFRAIQPDSEEEDFDDGFAKAFIPALDSDEVDETEGGSGSSGGGTSSGGSGTGSSEGGAGSSGGETDSGAGGSGADAGGTELVEGEIEPGETEIGSGGSGSGSSGSGSGSGGGGTEIEDETELVETASRLKINARFPGELGRMRVWLTLRIGQSVLGKDADGRSTAGSLLDRDVVLISDSTPPITTTSVPEVEFYIALKKRDTVTGEVFWEFEPLGATSPDDNLLLADLSVDDDSIRVVTLTVTTKAVEDPEAQTQVYEGLALDPAHKRAGTPDSVFAKFAAKPASVGEARRLPIVVTGTSLDSGTDVLELLFTGNATLRSKLLDDESSEDDRSISVLLEGGNDGVRPFATEYEGTANDTDSFKTGLKAFEDIEDISIVAAPGSTFGYGNGYKTQSPTIINLLISHAERMRYRIAVIDSGNNQSIAEVRAMRARIDSKYAAFYYPWVRVLDPVTQQEIHLPPSGFVAGIYARNDVERAVYKAPANEVVRLAIGFEQTLNKAQQEVLNPEGVNCFRFFEGRGFRLWGARTTSSDPEWKYVNLRRYFAYIERSIDRGTQWAVFEPNGEALWANVRQTIQDFLYNEWVSGALLGEKPEKAYFVRCDRSTMTQNDLDNGRLICLVGMAVIKPAEFVIFRIGQWTADRKV